MICADTSSVVALLAGAEGHDVDAVRRSLLDGTLVIAPVSLAELLSDPKVTSSLEEFALDIPQLEITRGYWERVGKLRALMRRHGFRPKMTDSLIAQSCLDHDVPLVTRDQDFLSFRKLAGLRLLVESARMH